MRTSTPGVISKPDSVGLLIFIIAGGIIAGWAAFTSIARIIELAGGTNIPVAIELMDGTEASVATIDGSATVPIQITSGLLIAPDLPALATVPGIIGQVILVLTIFIVIGCIIVLAISFLSGQIFNRRNTALVATAGITGLVGFAAARFFDAMLANAAVHHVTDNSIDAAVITVEPFPYILAAFIIGVAATAFTVGARLQRETEGLV